MKPRPIRVEGDIAYVPLTKGYEAIIDAEDVSLVEGKNWSAQENGNTTYAIRTDRRAGKARQVYMHRVIMGEPESSGLDHRDGNGLNNRRRGEAGNLRVSTRSENMHNRRGNKNNKSSVKGVHWSSSRSKWLAQIRLRGRAVWSVRFDNLEAAAAARSKKLAEIHGEFAREG